MKKLVHLILIFFVGVTILGFGIVFMSKSAYGLGAFDAFYHNFAYLIDIDPGIAMYIALGVIFIICMLLSPRKQYVIGLVLSLLIGTMYSILSKVVPNVDHVVLRVIYVSLGIFLIPFGATIMMKTKLPLVPTDRLLLILVEKLKKDIGITKIFIELSWLILAISVALIAGEEQIIQSSGNANLGVLGQVGTITLIVPFIVGPIYTVLYKLIPEFITDEEYLELVSFSKK